MNPVYSVNGIIVHDEPRWTKPKPLKKFIPDNHLLHTRDIDGAFSGWGRLERKEYRNLMSTLDVEGAQADTIKHSIKSERLTNPLTPVYQSLEGDPLPPLLAPLLPSSIVSVPTLKPRAAVGDKAESLLLAATRIHTPNQHQGLSLLAFSPSLLLSFFPLTPFRYFPLQGLTYLLHRRGRMSRSSSYSFGAT